MSLSRARLAGWGLIGDPTIADGPTVLREMERDAAKDPIGVTTAPSVGNVAAAVLMIVWIVTGILILTRQPGNRAGWVFLVIGVAWLASGLAVALVAWDVRINPGALPLRAPLAVIGEVGIAPLILIPLLFILFPDGRPPSPRWRWVVWALVGGASLAIVGTLTNPGPPEQLREQRHPLREPARSSTRSSVWRPS